MHKNSIRFLLRQLASQAARTLAHRAGHDRGMDMSEQEIEEQRRKDIHDTAQVKGRIVRRVQIGTTVYEKGVDVQLVIQHALRGEPE